MPNTERCKYLLAGSAALATYLVPHVGYEQAVGLAKAAKASGMNFREYIAAQHAELLTHLEVGLD